MTYVDFMVTVIITGVSEEKNRRFAFILPLIRWSAAIFKIYQDTSASN
jgi:hypothetical protein